MSNDETWNWSGVSDESVREIMRLAEVQLADLLTAAIAADHRAAAQASVLAAFGAAAIGAAVASFQGQNPDLRTAAALAVTGLGMVIAALVSGRAAQPSDYFASGYEPKRLLPAAGDHIMMLRGVARDMQARLEHNRASLERSARFTVAGYRSAIVSFALGVGVYAGALLIG